KETFSRSLLNYGYHIQAAMYLDGITTIEDQPFNDFVFIVVEKSPPYLVSIFQLEPLSLDIGRMEYRQALRDFAEYQANGGWAGYPMEIQEVGLPAWEIKKFEKMVV